MRPLEGRHDILGKILESERTSHAQHLLLVEGGNSGGTQRQLVAHPLGLVGDIFLVEGGGVRSTRIRIGPCVAGRHGEWFVSVERGHLHEERFGRISSSQDKLRGPTREPIGIVLLQGDRMAVYVSLVGMHVSLPAVPSRRDIAGSAFGRLVTIQVLTPEPRLVAYALKERGQGAPVKALFTEVLRASARLKVFVVY